MRTRNGTISANSRRRGADAVSPQHALKLDIDHPARLFAQLRAITSDCDPKEYPPLGYDIDGIYPHHADGSLLTSEYLFAIHVVSESADIAIHYEGAGANYRRYRLVYLEPIETYFWGEYQWRAPEGFTVRVRWHRIPKDYNPQLDQIRQRSRRRSDVLE
jgi:hypothetical protein